MHILFSEKAKWGLAILLLLGSFSLQAQDPILSQYFSNRIYLNPAYTGFEGGTNIYNNYREQWYKIGGNFAEFRTNMAAIDVEMPCIQSAFGLLVMQNQEGEGHLRWRQLGLTYAWRTRPSLDAFDRDWELGFGFKGSYNSRRLDWSQLVFSDQLDAIEGIIGPTALLNYPSGRFTETDFFDLDFGTIFSYRFGENRLTAGAAFNHIVRIDPSVIVLDDTLPIRATFHASYVHTQVYNTSKAYHIVPMVKVDMQKSAVASQTGQPLTLFGDNYLYTTLDYGVAFSFQQKPGLWGGVWMHSRLNSLYANNTNSLIFALGMEFADANMYKHARNFYRFGLSYDYNFSGITSHGGGTVEASLVISFSEATLFNCEPYRNRRMPCPKF